MATFLAVFAALFGDKVRAFLFPPRLQLTLGAREGEKTKLTDEKGDYLDDVRYYYVQVSNARRLISPAEQTQVFLTRIEEPGPSGDFQVTWLGDVPMRWRNQEFVPPLRTIGPKVDIDFCRIEKKGGLWLMPIILPNNLKYKRTEACKFRATLQARSNLVDSGSLRVLVAWDGKWDDGVEEMKSHFDIRPA